MFENEYVEVVTRNRAKSMVEHFNKTKTCDCNWNNDEACDECASMDSLRFQLENNEDCHIFVRFKFYKDDAKNLGWYRSMYMYSIQEYVDFKLKHDTESVKYNRDIMETKNETINRLS